MNTETNLLEPAIAALQRIREQIDIGEFLSALLAALLAAFAAQLLYRLGDSPSNCISPLSAYVWMMLSVVQAKYNKDAHIGIMLSNLVPYFVALQIIWVTFFIIWAYAGLPIGPGVTMQMPAGILP